MISSCKHIILIKDGNGQQAQEVLGGCKMTDFEVKSKGERKDGKEIPSYSISPLYRIGGSNPKDGKSNPYQEGLENGCQNDGQ